MDATLESITGSLDLDRLGEFLRDAAANLGGFWDPDVIVSEVVPMAEHHLGPARRVQARVVLYPERRLLVRLDDETTGGTVQEWEYVATAS